MTKRRPVRSQGEMVTTNTSTGKNPKTIGRFAGEVRGAHGD